MASWAAVHMPHGIRGAGSVPAPGRGAGLDLREGTPALCLRWVAPRVTRCWQQGVWFSTGWCLGPWPVPSGEWPSQAELPVIHSGKDIKNTFEADTG